MRSVYLTFDSMEKLILSEKCHRGFHRLCKGRAKGKDGLQKCQCEVCKHNE